MQDCNPGVSGLRSCLSLTAIVVSLLFVSLSHEPYGCDVIRLVIRLLFVVVRRCSIRLSIRRAGLESCSSMNAILFEHDCDPAVNPAYEPYHDPYGCDVMRLVIRLLLRRLRVWWCWCCSSSL